jgi:uncharacterized membrane protein
LEQTPTPPRRSENRTLMLVLSYLGILALVPLFVEKDDPEVQWHAKHGIVMFVAWVILFIALSIVSMALGAVPGVGWIVSTMLACGLYPILWVAILVVHIIAIMRALKGEKLTLPLITEYADKWR